MNRIGIITLHFPCNYGSVLQAYALQTWLEDHGFRACIIDYILDYDYEKYRVFRTGTYARRPQALAADLLALRGNLRRRRSFARFAKERLHLTQRRYRALEELRQLDGEFDAFVCGSDQIWNFDCTNGLVPAYFLAFTDKPKIAYAPSAAQRAFEVDASAELAGYLQRFDALSVRERETAARFERLIGRSVETVVDPTLLLDRAHYERLAHTPARERYVFAYLLEENAELMRYARDFTAARGLKLVYISNISKKARLYARGGISVYGIGPEAFLGYVRSAEYVITNSFHATVFSTLFERRFCTFATQRSALRMQNLLEEAGLRDRLYGEGFEMDAPIDFPGAEARLARLRARSARYLFEALERICV